MVSGASIQLDQTTCQRAFLYGFHDKSACNILAFSDHAQETPWENIEHYLLADRADTQG